MSAEFEKGHGSPGGCPARRFSAALLSEADRQPRFRNRKRPQRCEPRHAGIRWPFCFDSDRGCGRGKNQVEGCTQNSILIPAGGSEENAIAQPDEIKLVSIQVGYFDVKPFEVNIDADTPGSPRCSIFADEH